MASLSKRISNQLGYFFKAKLKHHSKRKLVVKKRKEKLRTLRKNHPVLETVTNIERLYQRYAHELTSPNPNWNVVDNLTLLANRFVEQGKKNVILYKQAYSTQRSIDRQKKLKEPSALANETKLILLHEQTQLLRLENYLKYVEQEKKQRKGN